MREIPAALRAQKNLKYSADAWVALWEINLEGNLWVFITNNQDVVTFDGNDYLPYPITWQVSQESLRGDLPFVEVAVANITRELAAILEHHDGLRNRLVRMRIVNSGNLADPAAHRVDIFRVRSAAITDDAAAFQLSIQPFLVLTFPHARLFRSRCRFQFKNAETCGFASGSAALDALSDFCDKSINGAHGCAFHGSLEEQEAEPVVHPRRYGGAPAIPRRRGP